jgi:putative DNA primase/helicase
VPPANRPNSEERQLSTGNTPATQARRPRISASDIADHLGDQAEETAATLLGAPNKALSNRRQLRYGEHGRLAIELAGPKKGLWCDFAANEGGDMLDLARVALATDTSGALAWARNFLGLDGAAPLPPRKSKPRTIAVQAVQDEAEERARMVKLALQIWREGVPIAGTPAELYLHARGVIEPTSFNDLAFHPRVKHRSGHVGPALLGRWTDARDGAFRGTHRIWITTAGHKADASPNKMALGSTRGACIRLVPDADVTTGLGIGEGIETCAVIMTRAGWRPIWACGDAGHVRDFPVLDGIEALTIFVDADEAKRRPDGSVFYPGQEAGEECAERWCAAGREARIYTPNQLGLDWADALTQRAA